MGIVWSYYALNALYNTLDYVEENFGKATLNKLKKASNILMQCCPSNPLQVK